MDDKFWRNRKVRELRRTRTGLAALGVWSVWWSWCLDDPALDGLIPKLEITSKAERELAQHLVSVGLWDDAGDSFRIHDFHNYNPSAVQVEHKREADRLRIADKREHVARDSLATRPRVASTRDPVLTQPNQDPDPEREDPAGPRWAEPPHEQLEAQRPLTFESSLWDDLEAAPPAPEPAQEAPEEPPPPIDTSLLAGKHTQALRAAEEQRQRAARAAWSENLPQGFQLPKADNGNGRGDLSGVDDDARTLSEDDLAEQDRQNPAQITRRFQALYEQAYGTLPYLGGKNVPGFPERVRTTARLRGIDPLKLVDETFAVWAKERRTEQEEQRMQAAPLAFFAARFGVLVAKPGGALLSPADGLKRRIGEALAKGDTAAYNALNAEYQSRFLGGRHAKPAASSN